MKLICYALIKLTDLDTNKSMQSLILSDIWDIHFFNTNTTLSEYPWEKYFLNEQLVVVKGYWDYSRGNKAQIIYFRCKAVDDMSCCRTVHVALLFFSALSLLSEASKWLTKLTSSRRPVQEWQWKVFWGRMRLQFYRSYVCDINPARLWYHLRSL